MGGAGHRGADRPVRRHLLLVGLSGSGKSTVGRLAARLLDTHVSDIDAVIERATGLSVAEQFQAEGESAFRARERQAVLEALLLPAHVVAPGAGWAAEPGNLDEVAARAFAVYLAVDPAVAAVRLDGVRDRPLLADAPLAERLAAMLARREPHYRRAPARIDANQPVEVVAQAVAALARGEAGW